MVGYTLEEKILLRAARLLRDNCKKHIHVCDGCIFDSEDGCIMYDLPDDWDILSEEEEEQ